MDDIIKKEEKILKCKQKIKRNLLVGILVCAFITWLLYSLLCLIARSYGASSPFNSNHIIILAGLFTGLYGTYVIGECTIYLIKVWWYKRKSKLKL